MIGSFKFLMGGTNSTSHVHLIIGPRKTHPAAVIKNTARTVHSPRDIEPSLRSSPRIRSRPPGTSCSLIGNTSRVSTYQAMNKKTTTSGSPNFIHWAKPISMPFCSKNPTRKTFGGVPTIVPTPPILAAYAMPSIKQTAKLDDFTATCPSSSPAPLLLANSVTTLRPMGSIITVVAVLLIHMLRKAVAIMNPPTMRSGRVPTTSTVSKAIRRCRFQRSIASAIINPPMNRKISLLA